MGNPIAPAPKLTPQQLNAYQRQAVLASAVEMTQQIFSTTVLPSATSVLNVVPRNVGLLKKFIVEISGSVTDAHASDDLTITDFGLANVLSQVVFTDLNNNTRIQTSGRHLHVVNTAKERKSYTTAIQQDTAFGTGVSWPVTSFTSPVVHGAGAKTFRMVYDVPIAYADHDLRGAIYANVVNAVMNLQLTINQTGFFADVATDTSNAVYSGSAAGVAASTLGNCTVTVYQVYYDQLPVGQQGVILPVLDLSTIYELKNSKFTPLTVGVDFPIPYANFRDFLSTMVIFNNDGATGRLSTGADINYLALQSANFTNLWKIDALLAAQRANKAINVSLPKGTYYFDSRKKPISTTQYGNMELVINPSTAAAGSYASVGWEDFALQNTLAGASSLS